MNRCPLENFKTEQWTKKHLTIKVSLDLNKWLFFLSWVLGEVP